MPIPSLPLEIIHEIAFQLRTPQQHDTHGAIAAGRALSLVCRRWYSIGQALCWKDLKISIASVPSLLAHFDLYAHLARLLTTLAQSATKSLTEVGTDRQGFDMLPRLLNTLQELRLLDLKYVHSTFQAVFQAAADLPHLGVLKLSVAHELRWNKHLASIFIAGFRSLKQFEFVPLVIPIAEDEDTLAPALRNLKSLHTLSFSWWNGRSFDFAQSILWTVDPTVLRRVKLAGVPACASAYEWLAKCPNLFHLRIAIIDDCLDSNFPTLLLNLSMSKSLRRVQYTILGLDDSVDLSPVTPDALFASLPSSLTTFEARQLIFPDSDSTRDRMPTLPFDGQALCWVEGMASTPEGNRCVRFWKERKDGKSETWYRCILGFGTWDEYDARYVASSYSGMAKSHLPFLSAGTPNPFDRLLETAFHCSSHAYTGSKLQCDYFSTPRVTPFLPLRFVRFPFDLSFRTFDSLPIQPLDRFSTPSYSPANARPTFSSLVRVPRKSLNNGRNLRAL